MKGRVTQLIVGFLLALAVVVPSYGGSNDGPAAPRAAQPTDWSPLLPPGRGKEYATALCGSCHTVGILALQRRSRQGWRDQLKGMNIARETGGELCACIGGPVDEEEVEILSSYLSEAFGPKNPIEQLPLNVNNASVAALLRLPGLGPLDAQKLIEHPKRGGFKSKQEIEKVLGVEIFQKIEDFVDVKDSNFRYEGLLPM